MKILTPGHKYELSHFENYKNGTVIQFIQKEPSPSKITQLRTIQDGITNESVIEMLVDRLQFLQNKLPCRENAIAITKLEEALLWLNKRTNTRINKSVEGTNIKH